MTPQVESGITEGTSLGRGFMCWLVFSLVLTVPLANASVAVKQLFDSPYVDEDPPGATCWTLSAEGPEGLPEDFDAKLPTAGLFCPECLRDSRYAVAVPLKWIEQRLIPPPSDVGRYSCDGSCQSWLLRTDTKADAALLLVRVNAPTICGGTGWCPGRLYERGRGQWRLAASFSSSNYNQLCIAKTGEDAVRLWWTPVSEATDTWRFDWRPSKAIPSRKPVSR